VNFEVSVWTKDPWGARRLQSDLNQAIWWALKDAGIVIAFPQVDVHLDVPVVESLKALGRPAA
jgi:small-conductance mechanosensitive channel